MKRSRGFAVGALVIIAAIVPVSIYLAWEQYSNMTMQQVWARGEEFLQELRGMGYDCVYTTSHLAIDVHYDNKTSFLNMLVTVNPTNVYLQSSPISPSLFSIFYLAPNFTTYGMLYNDL